MVYYLDLPKIKGRGKGLATVVAERLLREVKLEMLLEAACCVHSLTALLTLVGRLPRGQLVISAMQQPSISVHIRVETYTATLIVNIVKRGKRAPPTPPPPLGLIFPS